MPTREPMIGGDGAQSDLRRSRAGWVVVAALVAISGLWLIAFLVPQSVPGELDDPSASVTAEQICAAAVEQLEQLPRSLTVANSIERSRLVDEATDALEAMVLELRGVQAASETDRGMLAEWLEDWSTYLADRRDFARRLETDPNARFYVTQSDRDGKQITRAMDRFAEVNGMASCVTPDDIG